MSSALLSAANLHDPILPLARPVPVTLSRSQTIAEAMAVVRSNISKSDIHYFYVVDDQQRLVGVVPARHLLAADPTQRVDEVMIGDVVAIPELGDGTRSPASTSRATQAAGVPGDSRQRQLVGVVDVGLFTTEVIDLARRTYDDIFQLLGVHATAMRTPWTSFVDRFPWLLSNIVGGLLCAVIAVAVRGRCSTTSSCCRCSYPSCWRWPRASACSRPR